MQANRRRRRLTSRCCAWLLLAVMSFFALLPVDYLASAGVDRAVIVREHAGWNANCEAISHPPLFLVTPPSHGKVCAKAHIISIKSIYAGTESQCIGREVSGVRLVYQPDASYDGEDALVYGVQYPSHLRAISVKVSNSASAPAKVSIADTDLVAHSRQMPGPMPVCPQYIF